MKRRGAAVWCAAALGLAVGAAGLRGDEPGAGTPAQSEAPAPVAATTTTTALRAAPAADRVVAQVRDALDAGDMKKARSIVDAAATGNYVAIGDRMRSAQLFTMAEYCYFQAMTRDGFPNKRPTARKARLTLVKMLAGPYAPDLTKIADGDYKGACPGYLDLVRATVSVKDGRITNVAVQSRDDRPRNAADAVPKAIVAKQGLKGVDVVTGATITSEAVMCAAATALKAAEK